MEQPTPTRQQLAQQVLELAQSRLLADLRFFSPSLEKLRPAACSGLQGTPLASDGQTLFYDPDELLRAFRAQRQRPVRALLHLLLHWMLGHPFQPQEKDGPLWSLACDAAVEQIIAELDLPSCRLADDPVRRERLLRLRESCPNMTAVQLYNHWLAHRPDPETLQALAALFMQDAHALWQPRRLSAPRRAGKPGPGEVGEPTDEQDEQPAAPADDKTEQALLRRRQETLQAQQAALQHGHAKGADAGEHQADPFQRGAGKRDHPALFPAAAAQHLCSRIHNGSPSFLWLGLFAGKGAAQPKSRITASAGSTRPSKSNSVWLAHSLPPGPFSCTYSQPARFAQPEPGTGSQAGSHQNRPQPRPPGT